MTSKQNGPTDHAQDDDGTAERQPDPTQVVVREATGDLPPHEGRPDQPAPR